MSTPRRFIAFSLAAFVWLGVANLPAAGPRNEMPNELPKNLDRRNLMITLNVKGERSDYIPASDVRLEVQIKNGGAGAITITAGVRPQRIAASSGPMWPRKSE